MPRSATNQDKLWTGNFVVVLLINFLVFSNHFMLLAPFPFFVEANGGTDATAGMVAALFSVLAVVFRPVFGWLLDRGKRKVVLLVGILLLGLTTISYLAVASLVAIIALRMLNGVGLSCASTSSSTITTDVIPKRRFAEGMGILGVAITLATALAPLVGIAAMQDHGFPVMFLIGAGCLLVSAVLFPFLRSEEIPRAKKPFRLRTLFEANAVPASAVILMFMMTFGAIENFIARFAVERGLTGGLFFVFMSVAILLTRVLFGKVADRRGEAPFVYLGNLAMFGALLLLTLETSTPVFIASALLAGLGFGGIQPALQSMAICNVAPERRGAANSTFLSAYDIGIGFGGGMAGYLITRLGYGGMFAVIACANLFSILIYLLWARNHASAFSCGRQG